MNRPVAAIDLLPALEPQPISEDVLREKYLKGDERTRDALFDRVARALASVEAPALRDTWTARFREQLDRGGIGAGRIMSAAGAGIQATLINCFVQPVGDSIQGVDEAGFPGIYEALREAAETMRRGGGVGYDFSRIRPRGARVRGTASVASGPCSYINVFDQSCATVESAGARRGAQMGVLRIDHPDVREFITAKRTPGRWNNFNVSIGVPDSFLQAVVNGAEWQLVHAAHPGQAQLDAGAFQREDGQWVYETVNARELWDTVMRSAYDFAEPGILFLDAIDRDNNLRAIEHISATNPCGEQPLPPYGCCDLGPVILPRFVRHPFDVGGPASFDFEAFAEVVSVQVRALDNVLDLTHWPLPQQQAEAVAKRRIGVGFTGLGDALILMGLRYDAPDGVAMARQIAERLRDAAYAASVALAREKGAFPRFDADTYLAEGTFASRLPASLQADIRTYGIRNSHLLSIAPTGTVSLAFADNASNGIEPAFSWTYTRRKREPDGSMREYEVQDHAWRVWQALGRDVSQLPPAFVSALQMGVDGHLNMMAAVQPYVDTAISKTVNVPADFSYDAFKDLYLKAWRSGLKGLATYRPNDILGAVLQTEDTPAASESPPPPDPMRRVIERRPPGGLNAVVEKISYWTHEGEQTTYIVVSFLPVTSADGHPAGERAIEFFMPVGQRAESQQWITASMRLLSLAARGGFLDRALSDMRKVVWDRGPVRLGHRVREDGAQVPMWHDSEVAAIAFAVQTILERRSGAPSAPVLAAVAPAATSAATAVASVANGLMGGRKCPECGARALIRKDGCDHCTSCGYLGSCG
ncbi:MAG: adenosylcobalamin-dependent ribonucleoside-diphosphate reductase [Hydrogenophaga sp.]|uniref:adenosylcobalamin-dependent ribonucleoside-diphosphate reductase n=1 Tax=Hydrogenophaga sp. TaxID=1904254 RepID=UPI001D62D0EB|nr:adenosylcobalamin-dependent ribonucleoside-diphosphate reductase [Hydrogenophaga sp.]MBX3610013.1 adenosylcobalamin-dependent ribonucleoside-diphosphate reductase [Hydrogenophaga sp.]